MRYATERDADQTYMPPGLGEEQGAGIGPCAFDGCGQIASVVLLIFYGFASYEYEDEMAWASVAMLLVDLSIVAVLTAVMLKRDRDP